MESISTINELRELYGEPMERALWKEIDYINDHYQQFIEACPFIILATHGEKGVDCSPRGDPAGFVRVVNEKCIQIPDRKGNNRLDTLINIVSNGDIGVFFLIPGVGETLRLAGKATIVKDEALCSSFAMGDKIPKSVISIAVEKVYFQCQKAIARSKLWEQDSIVDRSTLPTAGQMAKVFAAKHNVEFDADKYDADYSEYMKKTIY